MPADSPLSLTVSGGLEGLIRRVVREVLDQVAAERQAVPDRCYTEAEAAAWLGVAPHQLRDARLRGEVSASRLMGRRVRYTSADLLTYLRERRAS